MNYFQNALDELIDWLIANSNAAKSEAITHFKLSTTSTTSEVADFLDALATFYFDVDIINNGTYASLRNHLAGSDPVKAKRLVDLIYRALIKLPEIKLVARDTEVFGQRARRQQINADLVILREYKASLPDVIAPTGDEVRTVREALNLSIEHLLQEKETIAV